MSERFNEDGLMVSANYAETMNQVTLPYLQARQRDKTVKGGGDKPIFCSCFQADQPRGTAMILHGFTENAFKFSEIIYSLLQNGFSVVAYDQRGHGRSWRDPAIKDLSLTHVDKFNDYVHDMECVCRDILFSMPKPWVLFAHSMGGAVASLYLERHPDVFSRAAFCAPMIAPNVGGMPRFAVKSMCAGARLIEKSRQRVFVSKPYSGPENFATSCATGKERFDWYDKVKAENPLYRNNGPTYGWTAQSLRVTGMLLKAGEPEKIACPVLLSTAQKDGSVMPEPQGAFIARVKQGKRIFVQGARHEIYRSGDDVLFPWWHQVLCFLKNEDA